VPMALAIVVLGPISMALVWHERRGR
jgi:hypothetical protein